VGPWRAFFHLTSTFFGLTSSYKVPLLEEIFICTQHLNNVTYADVLSMPVYERRFYLGLLTKQNRQREEHLETLKEQAKSKGSKGSRTTRISGDQLKNKINSGDIPTN